MESLSRFWQLFEYDSWANRLALASIEPVAQESERALKVAGHLLGAQHVWLSRFKNPDAPNAQPWPSLSLTEARGAAEELHREWRDLLSSFSDARLDEELIYRNTKGMGFKTPVRDVLTHLLMHSAYHRGQIAAAVREAGGAPAATDYIVYVRQANNA